jgi:hypothetical protein
MRKILIALAALSMVSAPVHAAKVQESAELASTTAVVAQMDCLTQKMDSAGINLANGTMWRYGQGQVVTAFHVWNAGKCGGDGQSFKQVFVDYDMDIAILGTQNANEASLQIDCSPMVKGDTFTAYGYTRADGLLKIQTTFTGKKLTMKDGPRWPGAAIMTGREQYIPGTSGGPVVNDRTGKVQGFIVGHEDVAGGYSYARMVADTPLCGKQPAQLLAENGVKLLIIKAPK